MLHVDIPTPSEIHPPAVELTPVSASICLPDTPFAGETSGDRTVQNNLAKEALVRTLLRGSLALGLAHSLVSCGGLPSTEGRGATQSISAKAPGGLRQSIKPFMKAHPGKSGFHSLHTGPGALTARFALADQAEHTLDIQYYIWKNDESGRLLAASLIRAADRGVRVRVLLDDFGTAPGDDSLLAIDAHPNIEVRMFNPVTTRSARLWGMAIDFGRFNRRMHNKTFIADNQLVIVGGRNIADEYFDVGEDLNFADYDVVAAGPVVDEVSKSFDLYWNFPSAIEITRISRREAAPGAHEASRARLLAMERRAVKDDEFPDRLRSGRVVYIPGTARALHDEPEKVLIHRSKNDTHLLPQVRETVSQTHRELLVVTPYFIPGRKGVEEFLEMRRRGLRVIIITNSLAATDVAIVHSAYRRYRKDLLRAGVELYENKPTGNWQEAEFGIFYPPGSPVGTSTSSLHAKTFTFDDQKIFIGSLNLDPRSIRLNTELGLMVDSPELTQRFNRTVLGKLEDNAYRLELENGRLIWHGRKDGAPIRFTNEPETTAKKRLIVRALGLLPIESQL